MDKKQRNIAHYLYLLILLIIDVWLLKLIALDYVQSGSQIVIYILLFIFLNVLFGIKEVTILENGIEKKYRFNFILNVMALLMCGPFVAYVSILIASLIYLPINQFRKHKMLDIPSIFLHMFSLTISVNIMSFTFIKMGGRVFESNFPANVFAILAGAAANFIVNILIICIWIKIYDFKSNKIFKLIRKEFLWIIKYDLWQAIYAILIVNTLIVYFEEIKTKLSHINQKDMFIFAGVITVAFVFYYPIRERLRSFGLMIEANRQNVDLKILSQKLKENNKRVIRAFISMLEKRDPYTSGHSERVAYYSKIMAEKLCFPRSRCEMLEVSALLHDIGKIGIDINIINKNGKLNDQEFNEIKKHPTYGAEILQKMYNGDNKYIEDEFEMISDIASSHHERYDGGGYPQGKAGEEITLEARIICVADALDAMTSDRSYRKGMCLEDAIEEIKRNTGTQFCPAVVDVLMKCVEDGTLKVCKHSDILKLLNVYS